MKLIPLTQGLFAQVSDEDYDRVSARKWHASFGSRGRKYYALRAGKMVKGVQAPKVRMHRFIMDLPVGSLPSGMVVDHIDGDSLNNQRENLEILTQRNNMLRAPGWKRKKTEDPWL